MGEGARAKPMTDIGRKQPVAWAELQWPVLTRSGRSHYILTRRQCCALPHDEAGVVMNTERIAGLIRLISLLFCLALGIYVTRTGHEIERTKIDLRLKFKLGEIGVRCRGTDGLLHLGLVVCPT